VNKVRDIFKKINIAGSVAFDIPMKEHTSFRVGGPADIFVVPETPEDIVLLINRCAEHRIPLFFLGEGANILVSDQGIRGLVVSMAAFKEIAVEGRHIRAGAGAAMSAVAETAARASLGGLTFIYGMPGSVGGSVYMNARCYGREIADVVNKVILIDSAGNRREVHPEKSAFSYKRSPFQNSAAAILEATFQCVPGDQPTLLEEMDQHKQDRERKGHYLYPSIGSVFKNNRRFGMPTGKIIDKCGLKGYCIGDAQVAEYHGNIIINRGTASAADILNLVRHVEHTVESETGFRLEREVILVGDWDKQEGA
jgi:UDP-N-acetylmuramate dehydrogenase